jgi:two-component system nitrate/nitrite response regulator NarL
MSPVTVVLADDHPSVRKSLRQLIECEHDLTVVAETTDGPETIRVVQALQPDVLVLDVKMPLMNGLEVLQYLRNQKQLLGIIILSSHGEQLYIAAASRLGADVFLTKSTGVEPLLEAIRLIGQRVSGERAERLTRAKAPVTGRGRRRRAEPPVDRDPSRQDWSEAG